MLRRVEKIIFFALVFFIASQVGLHFWPDFAYVHGIRIDYLSPTLYLLDILIFTLFILFAIRTKYNGLNFPATRHPSLRILLVLFFLSLLWNVFNSLSPGAHLFGIIKLLEFAFLGFYVAHSFKKEWIRPFVEVLCLSAILSSTLAIWQFIEQSSIGGILYYFGERSFTASTIGISTVNLDSQILRPYAAFPHPNVLAFFLFMVITFAIFRVGFEKRTYEKWFLTFTILISSIALIFTFSRVSIFLLITLLLYVIYTNIKSNVLRFGLGLSVFVLLFLSYFLFPWSQQFLLRGLDFRADLLGQSLTIFVNNPYFGIGLNNFFVHQAPLIKTVTPILFQPPHNVYVLTLLSLGLFGWWIFPYLLFVSIKKLISELGIKNYELRAFKQSVLIVFLGILIVGFVDHFFLTLEQGQIILALILGLSFVKLGVRS